LVVLETGTRSERDSGCEEVREKMQMRKQRQRTTWGTGMNPTGRYAHMFEGKGRKGIYPKQPRSLERRNENSSSASA